MSLKAMAFGSPHFALKLIQNYPYGCKQITRAIIHSVWYSQLLNSSLNCHGSVLPRCLSKLLFVNVILLFCLKGQVCSPKFVIAGFLKSLPVQFSVHTSFFLSSLIGLFDKCQKDLHKISWQRVDDCFIKKYAY